MKRAPRLSGWGSSKALAPPSGRVIVIDPANKPNWIPAGATIVYKTPTASAPAVTPVQPTMTPPPVQTEMISQYSSPSASGGQPLSVPIEQTIETEKRSAPPPEKSEGSLVPIIIAIIAAIVGGS